MPLDLFLYSFEKGVREEKKEEFFPVMFGIIAKKKKKTVLGGMQLWGWQLYHISHVEVNYRSIK